MQVDGNDQEVNPQDPLAGKELELTFPCAWSYTVIGEEDADVRAAIAAAVGDLEHTLEFSHESKGGKYRSYQLEVVVETDEVRLRIYRELHDSEKVRYLF